MQHPIHVNSEGEHLPMKGKVSALLIDGAIVLGKDVYYQESLVCVIDQGQYDDAIYVTTNREFDLMVRPDGRDKTWLVYDYAKQASKCKQGSPNRSI